MISPDVHRIAAELLKAIGRSMTVGHVTLNFNEGKLCGIETHQKERVPAPLALVDNPAVARAK